MSAPLPGSETKRLDALRAYNILDTPAEQAFDDIAELASRICRTPIGIITLLDHNRQWFKSTVGMDAKETPRDIAFCSHTILQPDVFVVPDASKDPRFADNPLVTGDPHIRFYAGAPLITSSGHALGALCIIDRVERVLTDLQQRALKQLAGQVVAQLELRRKIAEQERLSSLHLRMERELHDSNTRFQTFMNASPVVAFMKDAAGRYVYVNEPFERLVQFKLEEVWGSTDFDLFPEDVARQNQANDLIVRESNVPLQTVEHVPTPTGEPHNWSVYKFPFTDPSGQRCVGGVAIDITERVRAETAVHEARLFAEGIAENSTSIIYVLDLETKETVYCNRDAAAFLGYLPEEIQAYGGSLISEIVHPDDREYSISHFSQFHTLKDHETLEFEQRIRHASGEWHWVWHRECVFKRHADGSAAQIMGTAQDITDRKNAELALRANEEQLSLLLESVQDYAILSLDTQGLVTSWNESARRIKGYAASDVLGRGFSCFYPEHAVETGVPARNLEAARTQGRFEEEAWRIRKDGTRFWANVVMTPIVNSSGEHSGFCKVVRDISDRKQVEEALRQSEARLAEAQSVAGIGSWEFDIASREIHWSDEMFKLLEFEPDRGAPSYERLMTRYHPDDVPMHNATVQKALKEGVDYEFDIRAVMQDRSIRWFHAIGKCIGDQGTRPVRLCGTLRDITVAKELAARLAATNSHLEAVNKQLIEHQADLVFGQMQLEALATTDGLTGLKNHRAFQERLAQEFERSQRYHLPLSLLLLDVDNFKTFNDMFGHPAGDEILKRVAAVLQETARTTDLAARYGGEEFVLIMPETDTCGAGALAERIRHAIEAREWDLRTITVSIGVAALQITTESAAALINQADKALYASKDGGRNRVTHYSAPAAPRSNGANTNRSCAPAG